MAAILQNAFSNAYPSMKMFEIFDENCTEVCSIDNKSALAQVMEWRRTGDQPLSEIMMTKFSDSAPMS